MWRLGVSPVLSWRFAGDFCSLNLLLFALLTGSVADAPLAALVPGCQVSFLTIGAFYRIARIRRAISTGGIGIKYDASRFCSHAARGKDQQQCRCRNF